MSRISNVLMALLATQMVVFVYWLVSDPGLSWVNLGLYSVYTLWLVLPTLAIIYELRKVITKQPEFRRVLILIAVFSCALFVVECGAMFVLSSSENWLPNPLRFLRMWLAFMLVLLIIYRAWLLLARLKELDRAEADSRLEALQARIQPHFLFNSLNTISELAASMPDKAEEAIQSLAMLFRVSLENRDSQHSLEKEITLCRRFVSLESWRVSGGVDIEYDIDIRKPKKWLVPKLILQPLVENAIKYGRPSETGAPIRLSISESRRAVSIKIVNAIFESNDISGGHGIAVQNIQDRLFALYDDRFTFSQRSVDKEHYVLIQFPKVKVVA